MTPGIPIVASAVVVLVLRPGPEGWRVLLLRRAGAQLGGIWSQVSGGIEAGERGWQAALREVAEETALVPLDFYSTDLCEQFYEPAVERIILFPVFVVIVAAGAEPVLNREHSDAVWATLDEAERLLPFAAQRYTLRHVWAEFVERPPLEFLRIPLPTDPLSE